METAEYSSLWKERKAEEERKRDFAIKKAELAAKRLKEKYHVKEAILFGSLVWRPNFLWRGTDIDLMVKGLDNKKYFEALAEISSICHPFHIDLVPLERAWPSIKKRALKAGIRLE